MRWIIICIVWCIRPTNAYVQIGPVQGYVETHGGDLHTIWLDGIVEGYYLIYFWQTGTSGDRQYRVDILDASLKLVHQFIISTPAKYRIVASACNGKSFIYGVHNSETYHFGLKLVDLKGNPVSQINPFSGPSGVSGVQAGAVQLLPVRDKGFLVQGPGDLSVSFAGLYFIDHTGSILWNFQAEPKKSASVSRSLLFADQDCIVLECKRTKPTTAGSYYLEIMELVTGHKIFEIACEREEDVLIPCNIYSTRDQLRITGLISRNNGKIKKAGDKNILGMYTHSFDKRGNMADETVAFLKNDIFDELVRLKALTENGVKNVFWHNFLWTTTGKYFLIGEAIDVIPGARQAANSAEIPSLILIIELDTGLRVVKAGHFPRRRTAVKPLFVRFADLTLPGYDLVKSPAKDYLFTSYDRHHRRFACVFISRCSTGTSLNCYLVDAFALDMESEVVRSTLKLPLTGAYGSRLVPARMGYLNMQHVIGLAPNTYSLLGQYRFDY